MEDEMRPKDEVRQAWQLWNLLADLNDSLWKSYENEFLAFYAEDQDQDEDGMKRHEDP
jgi:hypothetical protein